MKFVPKNTKGKNPSIYKTLYLKEELAQEVEKIAKDDSQTSLFDDEKKGSDEIMKEKEIAKIAEED